MGHGGHSTDAVRRIDDHISDRELLQLTAPPCRVEHAHWRKPQPLVDNQQYQGAARGTMSVSVFPFAVRLRRDQSPQEEEAMKYILLIHQGDTPTPQSPEDWARLSEEEQKAVYADYKAINETPGVTSGLGLQPPETATTVRVQDGKTLTTDGPFVDTKEALGGYLVYEANDLED